MAPKGKRHTFLAIMFDLGEEYVTTTGYNYTICTKRSCLLNIMGRDNVIVLRKGIHSAFIVKDNRVACKFFLHRCIINVAIDKPSRF